VLNDDRDDLGILDAGDDLDGPPHCSQRFKVDAEHAFHSLPLAAPRVSAAMDSVR